jgi:hypothetical protein
MVDGRGGIMAVQDARSESISLIFEGLVMSGSYSCDEICAGFSWRKPQDAIQRLSVALGAKTHVHDLQNGDPNV